MERYSENKVVGRGAHGVAILCTRKSDSKVCIVKRVDMANTTDVARERALQEAALLKELSHPNIVGVWDSFLLASSQDVLCIVMDYAGGGDLHAYIKKRGRRLLEEERVLDWFVQITLAVEYLHGKKILHRDIKPQNIFLTSAGAIKLGDLGVAKVFENTSFERHTFAGTFGYMPPEIFRRQAYGQEADMWSLGCVLHEMATLGPLFPPDEEKHAPVPTTFSAELRELVRELLQEKPLLRPRTGSVLQRPFIRDRAQTKKLAIVALQATETEREKSALGPITEDMVQVGETYQLVSADGERLLRASKVKSSLSFQFLGYTYGGYSLTFGDRQAKEAGEGASSFSLSGNPGTYRLHSSIHNNSPLTFLGATYPAEWVVRDGGGKATKARETLQLKWQGGGETFTILGYGGQYAEWSARWYEPESEEVFRGTRNKWKATEFVLKIKEPATCSNEKDVATAKGEEITKEGYAAELRAIKRAEVHRQRKRQCADAARNGQLELLQQLRERGHVWDPSTCSGAASGGHLDVLKWARRSFCGWDKSTCSSAASGGHIDVLKWARKKQCPWDVCCCINAAAGGHLEVLKWAIENGCPWNKELCTVAAASGGHLDVLKWARENGCRWDEEICTRAAASGHLDVLKWAWENGCPWDERTCVQAAARGGHLSVLKWARENGCPWDESTCSYAAENGHLDVLKWARENGCPWDKVTCSIAAHYGRLHVLKWARENGCPWNETTCCLAAIRGNLGVLKWARENGCPWDKAECIKYAERRSHVLVLDWTEDQEPTKSLRAGSWECGKGRR